MSATTLLDQAAYVQRERQAAYGDAEKATPAGRPGTSAPTASVVR